VPNLGAVTQIVSEDVGGTVRYDGRTLEEWVPNVVTDLVAACDPLRVILFGSVARGDHGPDSDLDVLVVLPDAPLADVGQLTTDLRRAVRAPVPLEIHLRDRRAFERRRAIVGAVEEAAAREGRVLYGPPLKEDRRMPDPEAQAQEAQLWLNRAREDLDVADHLAANTDLAPRVACFHAQQAAEKAVKAALVHAAIHFPRTHDLKELVRALPLDSSVRDLDVDLTSLSRWAVAARYLGAPADATVEDASIATSAARAILTSVASGLGLPS
jgi:HEPN domain-containing protein/predicted nucleotidyltransferase